MLKVHANTNKGQAGLFSAPGSQPRQVVSVLRQLRVPRITICRRLLPIVLMAQLGRGSSAPCEQQQQQWIGGFGGGCPRGQLGQLDDHAEFGAAPTAANQYN